MRLVCSRLFLGRWARRNSAFPAVEAGGRRVIDYDGTVIDVGHICHADIGDRAVVVEPTTAPLSSEKPYTSVAKSVVNAAVEADVRPPVAGMPGIESASPTPVSRRPEHADRRHHPRAGHPVIAGIIVPAPVAGRPEVTGSRTDGLGINRQRRRADAHGNAHRYLRKGCSRKEYNSDCEQQSTDYRSIPTHH